MARIRERQTYQPRSTYTLVRVEHNVNSLVLELTARMGPDLVHHGLKARETEAYAHVREDVRGEVVGVAEADAFTGRALRAEQIRDARAAPAGEESRGAAGYENLHKREYNTRVEKIGKPPIQTACTRA